MITEKEYLEAQMIIKLYESQNFNKSIDNSDSNKIIPPPPKSPPSRFLREGDYPPKPTGL